MKQKLTSGDIPPEIPALSQLDLSHISQTFKPSNVRFEDIPNVPVISKDGKLKQFVNRSKRVVSMPMLKYKTLPPSPVHSSTNTPLHSRSSSMSEAQIYGEISNKLFNDSTITNSRRPVTVISNYHRFFVPNSQDVSTGELMNRPGTVSLVEVPNQSPSPISDRISSPISNRISSPSTGSNPLSTENLNNVNAFDEEFKCPSPLNQLSNHTPSGSISSNTNTTIDSLFSNDNQSSSSQDLVAKSIMEVLEIYDTSEENIPFKSLVETVPLTSHQNISVESVYTDADTGSEYSSVYTAPISEITTNYVKETMDTDNCMDIVSVQDSLFSDESIDHPEIISNLPTPSASAIPSANTSTNSLQVSNISKESLNKDLPPSPSDSIQPETDLSIKQLPEPIAPLNIQKTRRPSIRHRNSYTKPISVYDQRPEIMKVDSYRGVSNERPISERPVSMYSTNPSMNRSFISMGQMSLNEVTSEIKSQVRQRPFSYCLDSPKDYGYSRYTAPLKTHVVGNPYNNDKEKRTVSSPSTMSSSQMGSVQSFNQEKTHKRRNSQVPNLTPISSGVPLPLSVPKRDRAPQSGRSYAQTPQFIQTPINSPKSIQSPRLQSPRSHTKWTIHSSKPSNSKTMPTPPTSPKNFKDEQIKRTIGGFLSKEKPNTKPSFF